MAMQAVQVSAGIVVMVNGSAIGFATAINYSRSLGVKPIYGIDSPFAQELAITGPYSVSGTLSGFRLKDSGGLDGQTVMDSANISNYFNQKYVTLEIIDRMSGMTIAQIKQCLFDRDTWNFSSKSAITFTVSFIGVFIGNEATDIIKK